MIDQREAARFHSAIGRFVCAFSSLEFVLKMYLQEVLLLQPSDADPRLRDDLHDCR